MNATDPIPPPEGFVAALQHRARFMERRDEEAVRWIINQLGRLQRELQIKTLAQQADWAHHREEVTRLQGERRDAFRGWLEATQYTHSKRTRDWWAFGGFSCQLGCLIWLGDVGHVGWFAISLTALTMLAGNVATVVSCLKGKRACRPPK